MEEVHYWEGPLSEVPLYFDLVFVLIFFVCNVCGVVYSQLCHTMPVTKISG